MAPPASEQHPAPLLDEQLAAHYEGMAREHPTRYRLTLAGLAALGYFYVYLVLAVLVGVGLFLLSLRLRADVRRGAVRPLRGRTGGSVALGAPGRCRRFDRHRGGRTRQDFVFSTFRK